MRNSKGMIAAIAAAFLFVVTLLAADHILTYLILRSPSVEAGRISRIVTMADIDEIPIFGASKAEANYIPEFLGRRTYNYGFQSASPDVTNYLLSFEIRKKSIQPIIIDLHQGDVNSIGDVRNYIPFADRSDTYALLARRDDWKWYFRVPGLRYFGSWDWYIKGVLTEHIGLTKVVMRGYTHELNEFPWDAALFAADVRKRLGIPLHWGFVPRQEARLIQLIRQAPHRSFFIVLSPLHRSFFANAVGEQQFRAQLAALRRLPNVHILDFSHVSYPDRFFRNTGHLDYNGARVFSAELRNRLIADGVDLGEATNVEGASTYGTWALNASLGQK